MNKYDIIGDIHGHADKLEQLLQKMGYKRKNGGVGTVAANITLVAIDTAQASTSAQNLKGCTR